MGIEGWRNVPFSMCVINSLLLYEYDGKRAKLGWTKEKTTCKSLKAMHFIEALCLGVSMTMLNILTTNNLESKGLHFILNISHTTVCHPGISSQESQTGTRSTNLSRSHGETMLPGSYPWLAQPFFLYLPWGGTIHNGLITIIIQENIPKPWQQEILWT